MSKRSLILVLYQPMASFIMKLALQKAELRQASLRDIWEENEHECIISAKVKPGLVNQEEAQKRLNSVKPSNDHRPGPSMGMLPDKTVCCLQDNAPWGRILEPTKRKPITDQITLHISRVGELYPPGLCSIPRNHEGGRYSRPQAPAKLQQTPR